MSSELTADVLVVGGGPAAAGTGVWYVEPDAAAREAAMASREALGGHLADRGWMARVLERTYANINGLAESGGYPFPTGPDGRQPRNGLQGPEYMRRMRIRVRRAGVRILDHSPVTELLTAADGSVAGAAGYRRQAGHSYRVRAGAVVLATGGCAFLGKALGTDTDSGDGALFAASAGSGVPGCARPAARPGATASWSPRCSARRCRTTATTCGTATRSPRRWPSSTMPGGRLGRGCPVRAGTSCGPVRRRR
ncbi:FAD-binding protein [Kitasatospora paranensis]|uniref:FAD-binding protein n=1 Tax=Kitasatospora paranensis TaxID=258053 RepID=A0ABW2FU35_9ACTN